MLLIYYSGHGQTDVKAEQLPIGFQKMAVIKMGYTMIGLECKLLLIFIYLEMNIKAHHIAVFMIDSLLCLDGKFKGLKHC